MESEWSASPDFERRVQELSEEETEAFEDAIAKAVTHLSPQGPAPNRIRSSSSGPSD